MSVENIIENYNVFDEKEKLLRMARKKHEKKQEIYQLIWNAPWRKSRSDISAKTIKQKKLIAAIEENDEISYEEWKDAFARLPEEKYAYRLIGGLIAGGFIWHFLKK